MIITNEAQQKGARKSIKGRAVEDILPTIHITDQISLYRIGDKEYV